MKQLSIIPACALILLMTACENGTKEKPATNSNPLLKISTLPYKAPDFNVIKDSDFQPAIEEGMKEQLLEIEKIARNPEKPTFENTLVALEKSGQTLNRVYGIFNLLSGANTDAKIQRVEEEEAPRMAAHDDAIYLNDKLFNRVKIIHDQSGELKLDNESQRLVDYYYQKFILAGANLPAVDKAKLKVLNQKEASLSARFNNRLLLAAKNGALVVDNKKDLDGLSTNELDAAAKDAAANNKKGKYLIPLQNTTQQPALQSLTNRKIRQQLFENSWARAEKGDSADTRAIIKQLAEIRARQAQLLGFKNFAQWKLKDQMAKTPETVEKFLDQLIPAATANARKEAGVIQKVIDQQKGGFRLKPWDWNFYAEKVRKEKYDLDENEIKPYFELNSVLKNGVFYAAHELYGLTFKERHDIPVYQKDVRVFEVFDKDSTALGLFYCDYFKRDNKSGGAWMSNITEQSFLLGNKPVIYNVCNFTQPAPGQPALISYDDVTTMFHEFGHALHGFFAHQKYPSLSGTNVARDFVEFPSQFNEHWALYPKVFKHYALHYKTGKPMPAELVSKIRKAARFNQGYALTELLAAAELDMQWHTISATKKIENVDEFEKQALKTTKLDLAVVPPRYRSSYFLHIWGNGYAAGYYAYLWTEMLDDDAFSWFENHGGLTRENGQRFRDTILSRGNTEDYGEMFKNFTGHAPRIHPMLHDRGLIQ